MSGRFKKPNTGMIIGSILVLFVLLPVIVSMFWLPYDVNAMDVAAKFQAPSLTHLFGTDNFGRDIFCRVIEGTRSTFFIALFTVIAGAFIGSIAGALTGYYGGIADEILMRVNDSLASFPSILLALVVVSILDKGILNVCIALTLVFIPSFARIMRSEFIEQSKKDYVANARVMGAGDLRIMVVHIFPNTIPALLSAMMVGLNNAVLAEAGLSYLGLGVEPPDPSLGRMLSEAQVYIWGAPWYVIFPSLVMIFMILGISLISENAGLPKVNLKKYKAIFREKRNADKTATRVENNTSDAHVGSAENGENKALLNVKDLHVGFANEQGIREVISGISFELKEKEILGIVGESGSGKSMTALSIMDLLPANGIITNGEILYNGRSIVDIGESELKNIRGREISMIFQEPMTSLNPLKTIGEQIDEVLDLHASWMSPGEQREKVISSMADTGLKNPDELYNMYPHELSGGMRQRVMIAMAIISGSRVIIADEPTTALDAGLADVILDIFKEINAKYKTAIILISHDLEVIARICDRALVIRKGRIEEELKTRPDASGENRFSEPASEYGKKLLAAAYADNTYPADPGKGDRIVSLKDYNVFYRERSGLFGKKTLKQVNHDINIEIYRGDCVGIVGESGCGKTTLVKGIAGLQKYTSGICELKCDRPAFVFQDPLSSLNPVKTVGWILEEPLKINHNIINYNENDRIKDKKEKRFERVKEILKAVELDDTMVERKVSELSGGEKQRISIAESIILNRELIILDEPVSALDVTIREQVLQLLMRLKNERKLTFIIISHDRRLIRRICNRIYYMTDGKLTDTDSASSN